MWCLTGRQEAVIERGFGHHTVLGLPLREVREITGITCTETGNAGKGPGSRLQFPKYVRST
jgi:hypothetical protein